MVFKIKLCHVMNLDKRMQLCCGKENTWLIIKLWRIFKHGWNNIYRDKNMWRYKRININIFQAISLFCCQSMSFQFTVSMWCCRKYWGWERRERGGAASFLKDPMASGGTQGHQEPEETSGPHNHVLCSPALLPGLLNYDSKSRSCW